MNKTSNRVNKGLLYSVSFALTGIAIKLFAGKSKPNPSMVQFKKEALSNEIDFGNIINSSFNATALYDELKVKCHPDRFSADEEKRVIAEELFQEITRNKANAKTLQSLKNEAEIKLGITFRE